MPLSVSHCFYSVSRELRLCHLSTPMLSDFADYSYFSLGEALLFIPRFKLTPSFVDCGSLSSHSLHPYTAIPLLVCCRNLHTAVVLARNCPSFLRSLISPARLSLPPVYLFTRHSAVLYRWAWIILVPGKPDTTGFLFR